MDSIRLYSTVKRIYIGGLFKDVIEEDIANRLRPFGSISNVDIIYQQETGNYAKDLC